MSQNVAMMARNLRVHIRLAQKGGLFVDVNFGLEKGLVEVWRNPDANVAVLNKGAKMIWSEVL